MKPVLVSADHNQVHNLFSMHLHIEWHTLLFGLANIFYISASDYLV